MSAPITKSDYEAALSVTDRYRVEETARLVAKFKADRGLAAQAVDAFVPELGDMKSYALEQWEVDKADKIGRGMTEDEAIGYYLGRLKLYMTAAVHATGSDPAVLFRTPELEK